MEFHQFSPGRCLPLAHELGDQGLGGRKVDGAERHRQQTARVRIQRGFPQLRCVHLTQSLEAADAPGGLANPFLAQLVEDGCEFAFVQRVGLGRRLLATRWRVHAEQRRPCHKHMAGLYQFREVPEKQGQQQNLDVRAIDISVRQNADLAVTQSA